MKATGPMRGKQDKVAGVRLEALGDVVRDMASVAPALDNLPEVVWLTTATSTTTTTTTMTTATSGTGVHNGIRTTAMPRCMGHTSAQSDGITNLPNASTTVVRGQPPAAGAMMHEVLPKRTSFSGTPDTSSSNEPPVTHSSQEEVHILLQRVKQLEAEKKEVQERMQKWENDKLYQWVAELEARQATLGVTSSDAKQDQDSSPDGISTGGSGRSMRSGQGKHQQS